MKDGLFDCAVIGGGPAGLTAAIYLARYRRRVAVFDGGQSRAAMIPRTRNYPGFAHGITGPDLLVALREQAKSYGITLIAAEACEMTCDNKRFQLKGQNDRLEASFVIMATGLRDARPEIDGLQEGAGGSVIRYCPICDGFEATDRDICVYGSAEDAWGKALFMRSFSKSVTLLLPKGYCSEKIRSEMELAGVRVPSYPASSLRQEGEKLVVQLGDGSELHFDFMYPFLGCEVRSQLATRLGARHNKVGCSLWTSMGRPPRLGFMRSGTSSQTYIRSQLQPAMRPLPRPTSIIACHVISDERKQFGTRRGRVG